MNPKTELILRWLSKAEDDLKIAKITFNDPEPVHWIAAFHAQQAAEKYLKALLVYQDTEFGKTHDIGYLLQLCKNCQAEIEKFKQYAIILTDFAVESRYPFPRTEPSRDETKQAIETAHLIGQFVIGKLPQNF